MVFSGALFIFQRALIIGLDNLPRIAGKCIENHGNKSSRQ